MPPPELCDDELDNDCDTRIDCDDPDCSGSPSCCVSTTCDASCPEAGTCSCGGSVCNCSLLFQDDFHSSSSGWKSAAKQLLDEALAAPQCVVSAMGDHAGEGIDAIFERKIADIRRTGKTFWLMKSPKARPGELQRHGHS